jgi:hypothetical protein
MPKPDEPGPPPVSRRRCLPIFPTSRRTRRRSCSLHPILLRDPTKLRARRQLRVSPRHCAAETLVRGTRLAKLWKGTPSCATVIEGIALRQDLHVEAGAPFLERIQGKLQERARAIIDRRPDLEHLFDD